MVHIHLNQLTLDYPIYSVGKRSFKSTLLKKATGGALSRNDDERLSVRALDQISLDLKKGDRLILMGGNGSGKTTLLKVLAGIYEPSHGSINTQGKIVSLIDIMLGMDMAATGYENIRMRGILLGFSLSQIKILEDDIAEFTGLGDFLNMPISAYSSGMHMRLGFAVSTALEADIIIMDEWLSVGDEDFKKKADQRLKNFIAKDSILVVATHSYELANELATRIIKLDSGKIISDELT
jgi:lipopolysaccharide transport system ATP-binding protein